jgi:SAM-dependent methyltransferase
MHDLKCRFCGTNLENTFVDLGASPIANDMLSAEQLVGMEPFYSLHVYVCHKCFLVQVPQFEAPSKIFSDEYTYFSSFSESWLAHARDYVEMMMQRFGFDENSSVVELASNDGYLLQYFKERGVPVLGIEPTANTAKAAIDKGIPTRVEFFGESLANELKGEQVRPNLIIGNNVLAHVPDINDFVGGMKTLLADGGVVTMEFPHLQRLVEMKQFDTIYHEHFSYLSFSAVERVFKARGLRLFDVQELPTHGGSLRIFACHADDAGHKETDAVSSLRDREDSLGMNDLDYYRGFEEKVQGVKRALLSTLIEIREAGKTVAAYGAAAKGNTLLNYCGIRTDFVEFAVDRSPHKQGKYLPGTRIPVLDPRAIEERRPDYILILPWNLKNEIMKQTEFVREWGGKFIVPIPEVQIT